MTTNHYSAPESNVQDENRHFASLLEPLLQTKLWVRLCSIMGFITTGLMVLAGIGMMASFSTLSGLANQPGMSGLGVGMGLFYLLFSLLTFFPSLFLHKYAGAISRANASLSVADIKAALTYQKSFWKFVGIITLIYIIILGLVFVFAIIGGIAGTMLGR